MALYEYRAKCARVIDGDTIELEWKDYGDGFKKHATEGDPMKYRFAAVNAYEKTLRGDTTPEEKAIGIKATEWLKNMIEGKTIKVRSVKAGSRGNFGRYLAFVFTDGPDDEDLDLHNAERCLNLALLALGYGVVSRYEDGDVYDGRGHPREE